MTTSAPPRIKSTPSFGFFTAVICGAVVLGTSAMVFFFNPSTHGFYPVCMFHKVTGWNCPGCGATRSFYALLHGHFQMALKDNAFFIFCLGAMSVRGAWFAQRKFFDKPAGHFFPANWLWPLLIVALIFSVLRNLPAFSFLSP